VGSQPQTPFTSVLENIQLFEIAPSDGTLTAATTTNSDFGSHRLMGSFKAKDCTLPFNRRLLC